MNNKCYCLKGLTEKNIKEIFGYECKNFVIERDLNRMLVDLNIDYAIIYNYDSVITDYVSNIELNYENIMEARFFNDEIEIRIFNDEGMKGTIFREYKNCKPIRDTYILYPRYGEKIQNNRYAKELAVKKYIIYDGDDNQAYINYQKPCKLVFIGGVNE